MSCGVGYRPGLDPELLWLWCRPAAAAPIPPLAWETPYAVGMALEKAKTQKTKKKKKKENVVHMHRGILLTHKKEQTNAICSYMDRTKDSHTK